MSIADYITAYVPASAKGYDVGPGLESKLGQLLDVAYNIEYGGETSVQSSLNMLYLLAYSGQGQMRIFGPSNEKYHVKGGNDQVSDALGDLLAGQIAYGMELTAIAQNRSGTYSLSFRGHPGDAVVDRVVLALPFSLLKSVNYSRANFGALKDTAIKNLPMARTPSSMFSSAIGTGHRSTAMGTPSRTPATRTPGTSPEHREAKRASWSTTPAAPSARASARGPRRSAPSSSWPNSSRCCRGSRASVSLGGRRWISGPGIRGPRVRIPIGRWASTRASRGWKASAEERCTSAASTRHRTSRAT